MNLLCKFKYAIFLSSHFATLVLTKKGYCSTMTLLCKVKCTYFLNSNSLCSFSLRRKCTFKTAYQFPSHINFPIFWLNPRPISDCQLSTLLYLHLSPIYLVVFKGSYYLRMRYPILRGASRLDAFSVYPFPT